MKKKLFKNGSLVEWLGQSGPEDYGIIVDGKERIDIEQFGDERPRIKIYWFWEKQTLISVTERIRVLSR